MKVQTTGRILLNSLFRRWRLIVQINLVVLGTILVGSWLWPPSYYASSSIVVLSRGYPELLSPAKGGGASTLIMNPKEEINSEIEIIRSRPVLERVVQELNLTEPKPVEETGVAGIIRDLARATSHGLGKLFGALGLTRQYSKDEKFEAAVDRLHSRLTLDPAVDSQIIWIRYRSQDPALASQVVNKVAQEYQRQHLEININKAESTFYAEQIDKIQNDLKGLQEQLLKLKQESGIVSYAEQSQALLKKLDTYDTAQTNAQKEIIRIRAKVENIQALRKAKPQLLIPLPDMVQDPQLADLENKLVNLKFQIQTVLQRFTPESRQAQTVREQIGQLEKQIRNQVNILLERELAKLWELQAEAGAIGQTMQGMKSEIEALPVAEMNLTNLQRDIDTKQEILSVLLKKYQDSLLAKSADQRLENAKILSLAAVPLRPVFPNYPLNLGLGFLVGLIGSISIAFFLEYWDDSLKIPEDVERFLGRPVFASIPEL
ncbi:MAG: GumC family protein [Desulfobaccales bacterium]